MLVADLDTDQVLLDKQADAPRAHGQHDKIMTALLALENGRPDDVVTVPAAALTVGGSSMYLSAGENSESRRPALRTAAASANDGP